MDNRSNDDRVPTMYAVAARTDRELLPAIVATLLDRDDQRRAGRVQAWRRHKTSPAKPPTNASPPTDKLLSANSSQGQGYGLEL